MENKLLSTLGICRKAGKLVIGFDAVAESASKGDISLILLADDLSPKSGKEMRFSVAKYNIEVCSAPFVMEDIRKQLGKRSGILGVADQGLAGTIKTYLDSSGTNDPNGPFAEPPTATKFSSNACPDENLAGNSHPVEEDSIV